MAGAAVAICLGCVMLYGIFRSDYVTINILTCMVFFQNIVCVLLSNHINENTYNIIVFMKEIYVVLVILFSFLRVRKIGSLEIQCLASILILVLVTIIHSSGSLAGRMVSLRQLYLPFVFVLMGRTIPNTNRNVVKVVRFFVNMSFVSALFGFVEMAIGDKFWIHVGIANYLQLKGMSAYLMPNGLPGNLYSWDLGSEIGPIRRMASVFADPVILGQILAIAFVLVLFYKDATETKNKRVIYGVVIGLGMLKTFTKNSIIIAGICILFLIGILWHKKKLSMTGKVLALAICVIYTGFSVTNELSAFIHIQGLVDGIRILRTNIIGIGVGKFGNLSSVYSGGLIEGIGESFIGTAIGQLGIIAILLYGFLYYSLFRKLRDNPSNLSKIVLWLNVSLLLTSFLNNTAISFTNCFIYFILASFCMKRKQKNERNMNFVIEREKLNNAVSF